MTDLTERATTAQQDVTDRLRAEATDLETVAAWLDTHGHDLPRRPTVTCVANVRKVSFQAVTADEFHSMKRVLARGAGKGHVQVTPNASGDYMEAVRMFGTARVEVWTTRETVCVKRKVGERVVEKPDPNAPTVTVVEDVYEYDCSPKAAG